MKIFRMIPRYFRDACKHVFRNFNLSFASILCIFITLILVSASFILSKNVETFSNIIKDDITIVVFVESEASADDFKNIKSEVEELNNIKSVESYTKLQKKEELAAKSPVFSNIVSSWGDNEIPLYDELMVKVKNVENIKQTAENIKSINLIASVKYGEGIVEKLINIFKTIEKGTLGAVAALVALTAVLITNTIKLTIVSRKREIEIMRLVGASNITIKTPFIIEGFILGLIGSGLAIIITIYSYNALYEYLDGQIFTPLFRLVPPNPFIYSVSFLLIIIGGVVGMFGSGLAVRKYLKI